MKNNKIHKVAVLLTCFNRKQKTLKCLEQLFENLITNFVELNVFLVDDGSTDGTSNEVRKHFPQVSIIKGSGDLYWNHGMRLAWETASKKEAYDFFLWLNDDTYLFRDAISTVLEVYESLEQEAIIVGATCSETDTSFTTYGGRRGKKVLQVNGVINECFQFNGNFVLVSKTIFQKLGNLDPKFRHSFADVEYGMRANNKGIKNYVTPKHIGVCERDVSIKTCFLPSISFTKRLKNFYSPLGMNPFEYAYLFGKYGFYFQAFRGVVSMHLRVAFPKLWNS